MVGLYFAKALVTKLSVVLVGGFVPLPETSARWLAAMPHIVARQASANPLPFYKQFLEGVVLPHATLFAHLTAWGEAAVGVGLTLGLLTPIAALVGLFLVMSYGLATQWMSPEQRGFHLVLGWPRTRTQGVTPRSPEGATHWVCAKTVAAFVPAGSTR